MMVKYATWIWYWPIIRKMIGLVRKTCVNLHGYYMPIVIVECGEYSVIPHNIYIWYRPTIMNSVISQYYMCDHICYGLDLNLAYEYLFSYDATANCLSHHML